MWVLVTFTIIHIYVAVREDIHVAPVDRLLDDFRRASVSATRASDVGKS